MRCFHGVVMNYAIITRLFLVLPTLIGVSFISFALIFLSPGDPAEILIRGQFGVADQDASVIAEFKDVHGFNEPILVQYLRWLSHICRGDFGISFRTGSSVLGEFLYRFPLTVQLAVLSETLALLLAVPLGIMAAYHKNSWIDHVTRIIALFGISVPVFWISVVALLVFALYLKWIRVLEDSYPVVLVLPVLILTLSQMGTLMRLTRAGMLEEMRQNYIRTARAKGVSETRVVWVHALKNVLIPVLTLFSMQLGSLAAGTIMVETVFTLNGVGRFLVESIYARDIPVIQGFILIIALIYVLANLFADISCCLLDPRVRIRGITHDGVE